MIAIEGILQSFQPETPQFFTPENKKCWAFKHQLMSRFESEEDGSALIKPYLYHHNRLLVLYSLHCSLIVKKSEESCKVDIHDKVLEEHVMSALALANILHIINYHYMNSPRELRKIEQEEIILRRLLVKFGYGYRSVKKLDLSLHQSETEHLDNIPASKWFRDLTGLVNRPRLLVVRSKRVLDTMVPIFKSFPNFVRAINFIDKYANPVFAYLAWGFYVPRFSLNSFLLAKNVIPHPWMDEEQKKLGLYFRFLNHIKDKWFELGNDGVWLAVGLINCFILTGALAPWGMYLTVALYAFDVTLAAVRAYVELNRLYQLKKQITDLSDKDEAQSEQVAECLQELDKSIHYEQLRLGLSVLTTIGLFVGMLFAIPAFASYSMVPLVGAMFIIAVCVASIVAEKHIKKYQSTKNIACIAESSLLETVDLSGSARLFPRHKNERSSPRLLDTTNLYESQQLHKTSVSRFFKKQRPQTPPPPFTPANQS